MVRHKKSSREDVWDKLIQDVIRQETFCLYDDSHKIGIGSELRIQKAIAELVIAELEYDYECIITDAHLPDKCLMKVAPIKERIRELREIIDG